MRQNDDSLAVKIVECAPGMDLEELRATLAGIFRESRKIVGLVQKDVCSPLELLCQSPSSFTEGVYTLLTLGDEEDQEEDVAEELDLREMCAVFWSEAQGSTLDREAFARAARSVGSRRALLGRIYDAFEDEGPVEVSAFLVGASTLCTGDPSLKLSETFALLDGDGDGQVSLDEMRAYFYAIFVAHKVQFPEKFVEKSLTALADATAQSCFARADRNDDGVVTFDEFCAWFDETAFENLTVRQVAALFEGRDTLTPTEMSKLLGRDSSRVFEAMTDLEEVQTREAVLALSSVCRRDDLRFLFDLLRGPSKEDGDEEVVDPTVLENFLHAFFSVRCVYYEDDEDPSLLAHLAFSSHVEKGGALTFDNLRQLLEDPTPPTLQIAAAKLSYLEPASAIDALAKFTDEEGYIDQESFVEALALEADEDGGASADALADLFDVVRTKTSVHVARRIPLDSIRKMPESSSSS